MCQGVNLARVYSHPSSWVLLEGGLTLLPAPSYELLPLLSLYHFWHFYDQSASLFRALNQ